MKSPKFITNGKEVKVIPVRISYRIIELFSEGLYSSPNKAIEELVCNAFDAGASHVHVILSPDRSSESATIVVIDDGEGMDIDGLQQLWLIGNSNKRSLAELPKKRQQIGKFGIGKLATFVLARYLTHICKRDGKYYATTMDYKQIPEGESGGIHTEEKVEVPLRELTEEEAKEALSSIISGIKPGYKAIQLFGSNASKSWTVAIMFALKEMAQEIQKGRLTWVLRTAMPLRDDFELFLDGIKLPPSKSEIKPLKKWIIGKDLKQLPKPAPEDLEVTKVNDALPEHRSGLTHPALGRITGYVEVYQDLLTGGKSAEIGRSHGFFVYVRGRLIYIKDELFGMSALRHGTFARFRMVVNIDNLDEELRSSREIVKEGILLTIAQNILHGAFNHARNWLEEHDAQQTAGMRATGRIAQSPRSLTRRPLLGLLKSIFEGKAQSLFLSYPKYLSKKGQKLLLDDLDKRAETDAGLVLKVELVDLSQQSGIALLDIETGTLQINTLHPFVAANRDDYETKQETLHLLAMAEVLTEAHLYELGIDSILVADAMKMRDELLRQFARAMKRTVNMVAQDLMDASSDQNKLETELVNAFDSMGFMAVPHGGKGKPDGIADAPLGIQQGQDKKYSVSLEAKSKENPSKKVSASTVNVSRVALHRDENNCDHAIVVGPDFPTTMGDKASLVKQLKADREQTKRTITLMRVYDLARLVRLVPLKGIGLDRLRDLFQSCMTPEQSKDWVDSLIKEKPSKPPYKKILETIWELQNENPTEAVEWAAVTTALRKDKNITIKKPYLIDLCKAMSGMTTFVVVRDHTVELTQRPDKVIEAAGSIQREFPEEEKKNSIFKSL